MKEINLAYFMSKGKIYVPFDEHKEIIESYKEEIERLTFESTKWESKFYDEAKKVDRAIEYINWVWNNTNKPTNTIVALRTLENILQGSDKE